MLIDTHAHLYWDDFKPGLEQVLASAKQVGVETIINIGVDVPTSKKAAQFTSNIIDTYSTIGIHPHEAERYTPNPSELIQQNINKLEQIYSSNKQKVVAVGECGLDFFRNPTLSEVEGQIKLFQAQIDLSKKLQLPLVIHCRAAWKEIFSFLEGTRGVFHCYSGFPQDTQNALQTNYLLSFAANITYPKNDYLREAAKTIPLERIVLETDCPFLAPQSRRGQRNDPSSVKEIANLIAELKNISFEKVATQTSNNAKALFKI